MGAWSKLVFGLILLVLGIFLLVPLPVAGIDITWWNQFVTVLKGSIPPFLILLGFLIVWIEWEEITAGPQPSPSEAGE